MPTSDESALESFWDSFAAEHKKAMDEMKAVKVFTMNHIEHLMIEAINQALDENGKKIRDRTRTIIVPDYLYQEMLKQIPRSGSANSDVNVFPMQWRVAHWVHDRIEVITERGKSYWAGEK